MASWITLLSRIKMQYVQVTVSKHNAVNVQKFRPSEKERTPSIYFLSSPFKQREVTNFAKGGNLIASFCKNGYFPHRMFGIFLIEIKILLFEFLEQLPNFQKALFWLVHWDLGE